MMEKTDRERRCETCACWDREKIDGIGEAPCRARSPDGNGVTLMGADEFCLIDYTPLDMMNGLPDVEELLQRIQANMDLLDRQWKKIGELEDRLEKLEGTHNVPKESEEDVPELKVYDFSEEAKAKALMAETSMEAKWKMADDSEKEPDPLPEGAIPRGTCTCNKPCSYLYEGNVCIAIASCPWKEKPALPSTHSEEETP